MLSTMLSSHFTLCGSTAAVNHQEKFGPDANAGANALSVSVVLQPKGTLPDMPVAASSPEHAAVSPAATAMVRMRSVLFICASSIMLLDS